MAQSENKSIIKHFLVIGGGTAINLLIGLLTTPIITRIVNPTEYGQWSIFTMYASIGLMVFCLGLDQSLVRFFYQKDTIKYKRDLIFFCWSFPAIIALLFGIGITIGIYYEIITFEFEASIVLLLCIHIIVLLFNRFGQLVLRISYKSSIYSLTTIAQKVVYVGVVLITVQFFKTQYFLIMVLATIFSYSVSGMIAIISQRRLWVPDLPISQESFDKKEIVLYGLPFILSLGITTVFQSIDKISLDYYCTYTEVGIYSSAMTLVHIFAILQTTFNTLWTPLATEHYQKNPEDKSLYQKGNQIITVLMFFLGLTLILVKDVFALLLGDKYREAAFFLPFLVFNPLMYTISESTCMGIGFAKKTKMNIVVAVLACATNIFGNMILVPTLGGRGAAISTGISYIVFWLARTVISNHYYYVDYRLKEFAVVTLMTIIYATYNTFHSIDICSVVAYILCVLVLVALYKETIKEIFNICLGYLQKFIGRK